MIVLKEKQPLHVAEDLGSERIELEMDEDYDFDEMEVESDGGDDY